MPASGVSVAGVSVAGVSAAVSRGGPAFSIWARATASTAPGPSNDGSAALKMIVKMWSRVAKYSTDRPFSPGAVPAGTSHRALASDGWSTNSMPSILGVAAKTV